MKLTPEEFQAVEKLEELSLRSLHNMITENTVKGDGKLDERLHTATTFLQENGHEEAASFLMYGCGRAYNTLAAKVEAAAQELERGENN